MKTIIAEKKQNKDVIFFNVNPHTQVKCKLEKSLFECKLIFYSPYFKNNKCTYELTKLDYQNMVKQGINNYIIHKGLYCFKCFGSVNNFIFNRLQKQTQTFKSL